MPDKRILDLTPPVTKRTIGDVLPVDGATTRSILVRDALGQKEPVVVSVASASITAMENAVVIQRAAPASTSIALPPVTAQDGIPISIADWSAGVTSHTITITPDGTEKIAGQASLVIQSDAARLASVTLIPSTTPAGWSIEGENLKTTVFTRTLLDDADGPTALATLGAVPLAGATMTGPLVLNADPSSPLHAATKQYVDAVAQGLDPKASTVVATTANITLSAPQTIDGITVIVGDRVLVKNQSTASQNGIYLVAAGAWTRSLDADAWAELPGAFVFVEKGTLNADTGWVCTVDSGGTIGSTNVTFVQFAGAGTYTAGSGLNLSGTQFSIPANAVTNAMRSQMAAYTIKGNASGSTANEADIDINALTLKATPVSADIMLILDSAAGNAFKKATVGSLPGGGGGGTTAIQAPGGRLTLQSGVPVMNADQVASQNLYYAPDRSNLVPVRVSGSWANQTITSSSTDQVGLTLALAGSANWAVDSIHDVFLIVDGGIPKLATRLWDAGMLPTETLITPSTVLASGGTAGYITTGTGANAWQRASAAFDGVLVQNFATGARIPPPSNDGLFNTLGQFWGTGLAKTVSKVVVTAASDNNLQGSARAELPLLIEGSNDGTNWIRKSFHYLDCSASGTTYTLPVNEYYQVPFERHRVNILGDSTTGGSGYSINVAEVQFFQKNAPANGRRLAKYDGLWVNDASMTARTAAGTTVSVAQYEGTYVGTIQIDPTAAGQITAHVSAGPSRLYGVYNAYNPRTLGLQAYVPLPNASNYALSAVRWTPIQNTTAWSARFVKGLADEDVTATLNRNVYINAQTPGTTGGVYSAGIAVDNITIFSGAEFSYVLDSTGQAMGSCGQAKATLRPFAGSKLLTGIEKKDARTGSVVSPGADARSGSLEVVWRG